MDNIRIAILNAYDRVCTFLDNRPPKALHYYDDELHEYLKGAANTYTFKADAHHEDSVYLAEGNKLAFRYRNRDYYLNIMQVFRDEDVVEVEAYSLNFELLNEQKEVYKATGAMTFEQYLNVFDYEKVITLGNNEVSHKSIKYEWTGTDTMLARIFSLASIFDAEIEFIPQLNEDYSLGRIVMNVYQEHNDNVQGIGTNRTDTVLRFGKELSGVKRTSDISDLYTAIRPIGRDGLTVSGLNKIEYDTDGKVEFTSPSGNRNIYAVQSRDRFPSNLMANANERYIAQMWNYDTDNVNVLYAQALAELKRNCIPQVKYEVDGYYDTGIGDTVSIADEGFNPPLYLEARVTDQIRSFTDPSRNKTVFDNFKELQSEIDPTLLAAMNKLMESSKTYTCTILTDNGIVFKNGQGSTTLTASVMDVGKDVTNSLTIRWTKDGADLSTGKSITVNAADISAKAVYRYEAVDAAGIVRGAYEVTVVNVVDGQTGENGKTQYLHIKYSDDGGQTFTVNQGETPGRWMGYYIDFVESDSNNPDEYSWVKVEGPTGADGQDGKDGKDGKDGVAATAYSMLVSTYVIVRSVDGIYTPSTITLTGQSQTGENPIMSYACRFKVEETTDMSTWTTKYTSGANESTKTYTPSAGIKALSCSMYLAGGAVTLLDRQIIPIVSDGRNGNNGIPGKNGADAYTIVLSNESHTFVGGTTAALAGSTDCKVVAFKGGLQVAATMGSISGMPTGMSTSITNNGTINAQFTVAVTTAMTTTSGMLTIPITVDGKSFSKNFSFALALKGDTGQTGQKGDPIGVLELPTEPPTKYEGMLWKHTGTVIGLIKNATYRWNGSAWVLFKFRADNIEADSLAAISANLGTVNAGTINGAVINGTDIYGGTIQGNVSFELVMPITSGDYVGGSTSVRIHEDGITFRKFAPPPSTRLLGEMNIGLYDIQSYIYGGFGNGIFAKVEEILSSLAGKAPTNHVSSGTGYGVGTTANYGHVKTRNDLNASSYVQGEALSAYQGYLLNTKINSLGKPIVKAGTKVITANNGGTSMLAFTNAQLNSLLGVNNSSNTNTVCCFCNGDAAACGAHFAASYVPEDGGWRVVTPKGNFTNGSPFRLNYTVTYFG